MADKQTNRKPIESTAADQKSGSSSSEAKMPDDEPIKIAKREHSTA
jgi:hypothetical protein